MSQGPGEGVGVAAECPLLGEEGVRSFALEGEGLRSLALEGVEGERGRSFALRVGGVVRS